MKKQEMVIRVPYKNSSNFEFVSSEYIFSPGYSSKIEIGREILLNDLLTELSIKMQRGHLSGIEESEIRKENNSQSVSFDQSLFSALLLQESQLTLGLVYKSGFNRIQFDDFVFEHTNKSLHMAVLVFDGVKWSPSLVSKDLCAYP